MLRERSKKKYSAYYLTPLTQNSTKGKLTYSDGKHISVCLVTVRRVEKGSMGKRCYKVGQDNLLSDG